MIILQLTTPEFLGALTLISVLMFAAVLLAYAMGAGSVNVDLEVKRRVSSPNIKLVGYQPYVRENVRVQTPPPPPPPRKPQSTRIIDG